MSAPNVPPTCTKPPLIFVTHLPSASSFYASILQPLGLQFLSSPPLSLLSAGAVLNYGYVGSSPAGPKHIVLFSITQVLPGTIIHPSRITLSAGSEKAVREFHSKSEVLNKGLRTPGRLEVLPASVDAPDAIDIRAVTRDFDNNMLEAVYRSRNGDNRGVMYRGQSGRVREIETGSSEKEARRVLEWQEQVARSINEGSVISGGGSETGYRRDPPRIMRSESYPVPAQPLRLVSRETVTTEHYRRPDEREGGRGGMSGKAIIGTLLGAAAGAAFAYAMVRSESPPRLTTRRASYDSPQSQGGGHYTHTGGRDHVVERIPARSYVSARDESARPRYVEYVAAAPRVAQIDDKSYHSGSQRTRSSRTRSRSEVGPRYEQPLAILPAQSVRARSPGSHLSRRSSYKTAESRRERSPSRSRNTGSHVSSRSYHTVSTAKEPSAVSTTKIRVVPGERERRVMHSGLEREVDIRSSVVERARHVPLPVSVVSGMSYAESVAPSDSVSSIGTKRERERLRSRMSYGSSGASRGW